MSNDTKDLLQRLREAINGLEGLQADRHCMYEFPVELEAMTEAAALIERQAAQLRAQKVIIDGMDQRNVHQGREVGALMQRAADVQGERDANAILTAELEALREEAQALRADAKAWRQHQDVIRASTLPNTLHIQLRANIGGIYNTRDGVADMQSLCALIDGPAAAVGRICARYFTELERSIDAARQERPHADR